MSIEKHSLYVVATPIGNLGDISQRALNILSQVDLIVAEDTRHSGRLLSHYAISTPCKALHAHNERQATAGLIARMRAGEAVALISDAGTPLLSDPGFYLVQEAWAQGVKVIPVPGPSAILAALSVAGLPTGRFAFEGFLPAKAVARRQALQQLQGETRTLVFFEAPHRILQCLQDMQVIFGVERRAVLARELTKIFETVKHDNLESLVNWVQADCQQRKGEMVIVVEGAPVLEKLMDSEAERVLQVLLAQLPVKQAAALASDVTGIKKNILYRHALSLQDRDEP